MSTFSTPGMKTVATAVLQVVTFITMIVINYVATAESSGAVAYTNLAIANTHPVYGLPIGWAFAIWGIIFLTLGLFTGYQALPAKYGGGLDCPLVASIRVHVLAFEAFNSVWNFLFGWEQYWMALLDIVLYAIVLWLTIRRLAINYFRPIEGKTFWESIRTKLFVATPISIQTAWVTVATALNVQVNALEEGWMPSPSFSIGCCWTAVAVGLTLTVFPHADLPYALATIWALGGIISNQSPDTSTFGCVSRICGACNRADLPICERLNSAAADRLPNGWAGLGCAAIEIGNNITGSGTATSAARNGLDCIRQVVPKSPAVVWWSVAGMATVGAVFVAGVVRARCAPQMGMSVSVSNKERKMEDGRSEVPMPAATPKMTASM